MVASAKALPKFWHLFKDGDWDYHLCNFAALKKYNHIGQYVRYKKIIGIKENCEVLIEIYVIWRPASFLDFGTSPFSEGCRRAGTEQGLAPNLIIKEHFSDVMITWLHILPDWVGCSNGMIWASLKSIFQWDFRKIRYFQGFKRGNLTTFSTEVFTLNSPHPSNPGHGGVASKSGSVWINWIRLQYK